MPKMPKVPKMPKINVFCLYKKITRNPEQCFPRRSSTRRREPCLPAIVPQFGTAAGTVTEKKY